MGDVLAGQRAERIVDLPAAQHVARQARRAEQVEQQRPVPGQRVADHLHRAQQAAVEQARIAYRSTVLTALQEVEDALAQLQGDKERLVQLLVAQEAARNASLLANQRYSSGLVDFQTVLDTQRTLLSAQDSVATAQAAISTDHVRLYKALGGGWQPLAEQATTAATVAAQP